MKKRLCAALLCLALAGCAAPPDAPAEPAPANPGLALAAVSAPGDPTVYVPDRALGPEEVVRAFFEQHYRAYLSNAPTDLSALLDTEQTTIRSMAAWTDQLLQRRRLIAEHGLAYVETERFDYTLTFADAPPDGWGPSNGRRGQSALPGEITLYCDLSGEPGEAYPPMFAMNTRHTLRLRPVDGVWKITAHSFPGSARKFRRDAVPDPVSDADCLAALRREFAPPAAEAVLPAVPAGARAYSAEKAAGYALAYAESPNPVFYRIGDRMGDCANFTSQAVWYGFAGEREPSVAAQDNMTAQWFAGGGGGSPAWENVGYFWAFAAGGRVLGSAQPASVTELVPGDVVQLRNTGREDRGFNHSLLVVEGDTLKLAQHSPNSFVYYADVFGAETRFLRPAYLWA